MNLTNRPGGADAGNQVIRGQTTAFANIDPVPASSPDLPAQQLQNTVAQVQSLVAVRRRHRHRVVRVRVLAAFTARWRSSASARCRPSR
ncbi:protein of unknown function [Burkholderia multivorans]